MSFAKNSSNVIKTFQDKYKKFNEIRDLVGTPRVPFSASNLLNFEERRYGPEQSFQLKLLHDTYELPESGHIGTRNTLFRIKPNFYYWKSMRDIIREYVQSCEIYQKIKSSNHERFGLLQSLEPLSAK